MDNVLWVTMFSRSISKRARKTLIFALSMWMGFILSCALCGKELLFSLFVSLLVEACAGDIPSIPDHFKVLNSFVVAFCNCWCNASRTKGGAKNTAFNLLCLLFGDLPIRNCSCCHFFSSLAALSFCLHAAFICFPSWCDVLIKRMATWYVCQKFNTKHWFSFQGKMLTIPTNFPLANVSSLVYLLSSCIAIGFYDMEELFACTSFLWRVMWLSTLCVWI